MVNLTDLPPCVLCHWSPFVVAVPRILSKLRCTCKNFKDFFEQEIYDLIYTRIFAPKLHVNTRVGCLRTFSKFALRGVYTITDTSFIFKNIFQFGVVEPLRRAAINLLFSVSERFGYFLILDEFIDIFDRVEFINYCKNTPAPKYTRDAQKCPAIKMCLRCPDTSFVAIALIVLRSYAESWTEKTQMMFHNFEKSRDSLVSSCAFLGNSYYKKKT